MKPAEEYILKQSEPFKSILLHIQLLIETNYSEVEMQYKWKIPVYYLNKKQLCYLNVSHKKGYVDVGFWAKNMLNDYNHVLISEGRKMVKSLRYYSVNDINEEILLNVCNEIAEYIYKS